MERGKKKKYFFFTIGKSALFPCFGEINKKLKHIRWRAIVNPHTLKDI